MSRKGNCLDNSLIENFFGKMKCCTEINIHINHENAMEEYMKYYNTQRITTKLKGLTPVQFRNQSLVTA
ncbi:MAG: IS3 family transposase [Erysipelotrichaceae bacterium]|nr:IS3 family transposase [Erysipelotrichaceae bacterium]